MTVKPDEVDVLEALHRVAGGKAMAGSERQRALLQYLVTEEIQGRGTRLKAYAIATSVLDRLTDFDPQTDSIVRVEVGRLRKTLDLHYATEGARDPLRILIEKGGYRPIFEMRDQVLPVASGTVATGRARAPWILIALAFAAALAMSLSLALLRKAPPAPSFQRLAVLPFKADAGFPAAIAPLAGLQADLAARLSEFDWLSVVPLRNVPPSIRDAGFLNAVEVTLHVTGDVLTATAHLVDGATGAVRWASTYDAVLPAGDLLAH